MLILTHPDTLLHRTIEILCGKCFDAYECPERLEAILSAVKEKKHGHRLVDISKPQNEDEEGVKIRADELLSRSHDKEYISYLQTIHRQWVEKGVIKEDQSLLPECFFVARMAKMLGDVGPPVDVLAKPGYYSFDLSTGIMKDTWKSIIASAKLVVEGIGYLFGNAPFITGGASKDILVLTRPPGHHCTTDMAGGYCYVNNAVLAVLGIQEAHQQSHAGKAYEKPLVGIVDIDFHHGNGTQQYFYEDPSVAYFSVHGKDEYPYFTGKASETGRGAGEGFNKNVPLPAGSSLGRWMAGLSEGLSWLESLQPQYLVVSLGFDTHHMDIMGNFKIGEEDYHDVGQAIRCAIKGVPSMILLEGGYHIPGLGESMVNFLKGWEDVDTRDERALMRF